MNKPRIENLAMPTSGSLLLIREDNKRLLVPLLTHRFLLFPVLPRCTFHKLQTTVQPPPRLTFAMRYIIASGKLGHCRDITA